VGEASKATSLAVAYLPLLLICHAAHVAWPPCTFEHLDIARACVNIQVCLAECLDWALAPPVMCSPYGTAEALAIAFFCSDVDVFRCLASSYFKVPRMCLAVCWAHWWGQ
jgi:hypothetical protein